MSAEPRRRPPLAKPRNTPRPYYVACHHIDGRTGERCCKPTVNGKHACPDCLKRESAGAGWQSRYGNKSTFV